MLLIMKTYNFIRDYLRIYQVSKLNYSQWLKPYVEFHSERNPEFPKLQRLNYVGLMDMFLNLVLVMMLLMLMILKTLKSI